MEVVDHRAPLADLSFTPMPKGFVLHVLSVMNADCAVRVVQPLGDVNVGHSLIGTLFLSLIFFSSAKSPLHYVTLLHYVKLAESHVIGCHPGYLVLCGLGVPPLRSLWGAVQI